MRIDNDVKLDFKDVLFRPKHRASEGREVLLPFKGDVHDFIDELFGSLRSSATYIGALKLKEFSKRTTFLLVNHQLNRSLEKYE